VINKANQEEVLLRTYLQGIGKTHFGIWEINMGPHFITEMCKQYPMEGYQNGLEAFIEIMRTSLTNSPIQETDNEVIC